MRKIALLATATSLAILGVTSGAGATTSYNGTDCTYAKPGSGQVTQSVGTNVANDPLGNQLYVYVGTGGANSNDQNYGSTGTAYTAAGLCANFPAGTGTFEGGTLEVGEGTRGVYAIADGNNNNAQQGKGYIGLSDYETGGKDTSCDGTDTATSSTNSGGCVGVKTVAQLPIPFIICGNTSGDDWNGSTRDGCYIP